MNDAAERLDIAVIGASGDLARKKVFPALFSLYCQGLLPEACGIYGFARSELTQDSFRAMIAEKLTCRYVPEHDCEGRTSAFLSRCSYVKGSYGSRDSFLDLFSAMQSAGGDAGAANRLFFCAIPPGIFSAAANALGGSGMVHCGQAKPWSRVVVEKPFGRDRQSSDLLVRDLAKVFSEHDTFRIDHYLGKEAIQNLMVLRFANAVLEPLWCRKYIESVDIEWKEDFGCEGRGGYFDEYGIIRDVVQNHLMQILALAAMERPADAGASAVRDAKVAVLRAIQPPGIEDMVLGQYTASVDGRRKAYREDATVREKSITPTFAVVKLKIDNERWRGVPFTLTAGKALDQKINQLKIRFRKVEGNIFCKSGKCPAANELIIRIQPDEGIFLKINSKVPGMEMVLKQLDLDMEYKQAFSHIIPEAYERLLLDVIAGERGLFIRSDELEAAWDIFTPVLHYIENNKVVPEFYAYGSAGPAGGRNDAA